METVYISERLQQKNGTWEVEFSENDENEYKAFCTLVGQIIIEWAMVDQQIDFWSDEIFKKLGGNLLPKWNKLPKGARRRTEFLTDCFQSIPRLTHLKIEAMDLMQRVGVAAKTRDDFIHGSLIDMKPKNGAFEFHKLDHSQIGFSYRKFSITGTIIFNLHVDIVQFQTRALAISDEIQKMARGVK